MTARIQNAAVQPDVMTGIQHLFKAIYAGGVPRATLVIIAGTCASFGLPGEAGVAMLLAVDEVMDMARSAVNVTGNALASVVIAKWEGVFGQRDTDSEIASSSVGQSAISSVSSFARSGDMVSLEQRLAMP